MRFSFPRTVLTIISFLILSSFTLAAQDTIYSHRKPQKPKFMERVSFGGSLGAQFGDITFIDIAPIASYRVTKNFYAGLGLTYMFYKSRSTPYYPEYKSSSYGGSVFGRYFIWRDLFVHAEYAPLYVGYYGYDALGTWGKGHAWVQDIFLGGGYRQWVSNKAFMSLMLLWNLNPTTFSPYSNPIIRIGFGVGL